jgi:hypothetical protein
VNTYPTPGDYAKALVNPANTFTSPELRSARFDVNRFGMPPGATGANAVVFKADVHGRAEALRFFTRHDASSRDRHQALRAHVVEKGISDYLADAAWVDDAVTVNGRTWPMLRMEWIDGRPLDRYTESLVERNDTGALANLAELWRAMVKRLQNAGFAHGDLQHNNVFVDQAGRLRLVDLDGCWVPALARHEPPSEQGHPNYQRPSRQWNRWMDTFPALVVYLSLTALAKNPRSWDELYSEDNLLFEEHDFSKPHETTVWRRLHTLDDGQVAALAKRLGECCDPSWPATGTLEQLLLPRWWEQESKAPAPPPAPVDEPVVRPMPKPPVQTAPPRVPASRTARQRVPAVPVGAPPPSVWWTKPAVPGVPPPRGPVSPPPGTGRTPSPSAPRRTTPVTPPPPPVPPGRKPAKVGTSFAWTVLVAVLSAVLMSLSQVPAGAVLILAVVVSVFTFALLMFFRS